MKRKEDLWDEGRMLQRWDVTVRLTLMCLKVKSNIYES